VPVCGNGEVEGYEICDQNNVGFESCRGLNWSGGTLGCKPDCSDYDTSKCWGCGDGIVSGDEACDTNAFAPFASASCADLGLGTGTILCTQECTLDAHGCSQDLCEVNGWYGDGICDPCDVLGGVFDSDCEHCDFDGVCANYFDRFTHSWTCDRAGF